MPSILILGGSGYVSSAFRDLKLLKDLNLKFFSRRKCDDCIQYRDLSELPISDIVIDFSQWANGDDINKFGFENMKNSMLEISKKSSYYFFASTIGINIDEAFNYESNSYTINKKKMENELLDVSNIYSIRLPTCFYEKTKKCTLIDVLFKRAMGISELIAYPEKYTTGLHIQDLANSFKTIIKKINDLDVLFNQKKIISLGDGNAYNIRKLDSFIKNYFLNNIAENKSLSFFSDGNYLEMDLLNSECFWLKQPTIFPLKLCKTINSQIKC